MLLTDLVSAVRAVGRGDRVMSAAVAQRLAENRGRALSPRELQVLRFGRRGQEMPARPPAEP